MSRKLLIISLLMSCITVQLQRFAYAATVCNDYIGSLPEDFNPSDYNVFQGDFDSDRQSKDILFFGRQKIVLLHGNIITPIVLKGAASFKLIRQSNGGYIRKAAEKICNGELKQEYNESSIGSLIQSGAISEILLSNIQTAGFNSDGRDDFLVRIGSEVSIFHWNNSGAKFVSSITIPPNYHINIRDLNNDGRADIEVFNSGEFIRVFIADNQGFFTDIVSASSKVHTIKATWQNFADALKQGNHNACKKYLTPGFNTKFSEVLGILGDEAAEVVEQVESIAPYFSNNEIAIYLMKKLDDKGKVNIHTITFKAGKNGSWKINEL